MRTKRPKYKILHLINTDQRRGAEVFASQLAQNLCEDRFESSFCIITPSLEGDLPITDYTIYTLQDVPCKKPRGLKEASALWRLRKVSKEFHPQLVICHGSNSLKYGVMVRWFLTQAQLIYRNIGMASFWVKTRTKLNLNRLLLRQCDAVVTLSPKTRDDISQLYSVPEERIFIIPNGIDFRPFQSQDRQRLRALYRRKLNLSEDENVLITVGNLSEEKNQKELLNLVADLLMDGVQNRLLIVGDGPQRQVLEEKSDSLGISNSVRFMGVRDDVAPLLMASDLFVLSSKTEGMPAVLIEAAAAGVASVAYDVGAVPEVIQDDVNGLVVPFHNQLAFKNAVSQLLRDDSRRESMARVASQECQSRFDILRVARQYEELFVSLCERTNPSA